MTSRAMLPRFVLLMGIILASSCLAADSTGPSAELTITLDTIGTQPRDATLQIVLLNDTTDLLKQIEALKNQSKPELEPLVKRYMYAAEMLTRFAAKPEATNQEQKDLMTEVFYTSERAIHEILAQYRIQIDTRLQHQTVRTQTATISIPGQIVLAEVAPGAYRVFCTLTFATTTHQWFTPVVVKGGDRQSVTLTRENLMNPYWTDLNWWSFMNLDFSKHH